MALPCSASEHNKFYKKSQEVPCDGYCSPGPDIKITVEVRQSRSADVSRSLL